MKSFRCTYREPSGKIESDRVEANNQAEVIDILSGKNFIILSITEETAKVKLHSKRTGKIKDEDIVIFVRQLSTMIDAGIPLLQSLQTLSDQAEEGKLKQTLSGVEGDVTHGKSFSDALSAFPKIFDNLFVNMVRAGEAGGFLSDVLEKLANYLEASVALKRKVKSALMYPAIVLSIAFLILVLLIVKVIPVFEGMFSDFGADLPLPTRILISTSHFMIGWWWLIIACLVGAFLLLKWYTSTTKGKLQLHTLYFNIPVFGSLIRKVAIAKFTSTLASLISSGVSIIQSLEIVSESCTNDVLKLVIRDATRRTEKGDPIADAFNASPYIPKMVCKMISIGESTGKLDSLLARVSSFYTQQVNTTVDGITTLIEPVMIVFLGVIIGGVMLAMFMPIFKMSSVV